VSVHHSRSSLSLCFLVAGVELLDCNAASRVPFGGCFTKQSLVRSAHYGLFISNLLQEQIFDGLENKKPSKLCSEGFL